MAHIRGQAPPTQERLKELFVLNEEKRIHKADRHWKPEERYQGRG